MFRRIRQLSIEVCGEMLAGGGKMILGSDSHTRYGALGTMAMGEGDCRRKTAPEQNV